MTGSANHPFSTPASHRTPPAVICRAGDVAWRVAAAGVTDFQGLLERHCRAGRWEDVTVLKDDVGTRVVATPDWVIKESTPRRGRGVWRFGLRRSGSRRAFTLGQKLLQCGIPTPEPLAWATTRRGGLRVKDCLITHRFPDAEDLKARAVRLATDRAARTETLHALGVLVADFHRNGFSNRDLKDANILCPRSGKVALCVVDLDGVRQRRVISRWRATRDLWAVVRTLAWLDWLEDGDVRAFLAGYNADAPERLQRVTLPHLPKAQAAVRFRK